MVPLLGVFMRCVFAKGNVAWGGMGEVAAGLLWGLRAAPYLQVVLCADGRGFLSDPASGRHTGMDNGRLSPEPKTQ